MIDFHSHILPNVDDGSASIEETMNLLKEAKEVGFESVISTSHFVRGYFETNVKERKELLESVSDELQKQNIDVKLYLGNEIYFSDDIVKLIKAKKVCPINGTKYVLMELPLSLKPLNMYDVIYEIMEAGYKIILAHPERYSFIQKNPSLIKDLIEKGILIQSNYGSFIGLYGPKAQIIVKKMLESNMVHFLGSDVHKQDTIYPKISEILVGIEKLIGKEKLELLTTKNAKLVLNKKTIDIEEPKDINLSLKEKIIMKTKKHTG